MKNRFYVTFVILCITTLKMTYAQIGVRINSTVQTFPGGHLRIDAQDLTFFSGHIITPRESWETSSVYFTDGSTIVGVSDVSYVNGYVTKVGQNPFSFPVGAQNGGDFRSLDILGFNSEIELAVAYWSGDVGKSLDPTGGAHDRNIVSNAGMDQIDKITSISSQGFWDWVPISEGGEVVVSVSIPDNSGMEGYLASSIRLVGWNTSTNQWENLSGSNGPASNAEGTKVTGVVSDMNLYSAITIGSVSLPLPVKLISFDAKKESAQVKLEWKTSDETNADFFEIQRSQNAKDWKIIGKQKAVGESVTIQEYSFTDLSPFQGGNYYRLKMVDKDETFAFSTIHNISIEGSENVLTLFPNPVSELLQIKFIESQLLQYVSIHDLRGKEVYKSSEISRSGVNLSNLISGLYVVTVHLNNGGLYTGKISIVH